MLGLGFRCPLNVASNGAFPRGQRVITEMYHRRTCFNTYPHQYTWLLAHVQTPIRRPIFVDVYCKASVYWHFKRRETRCSRMRNTSILLDNIQSLDWLAYRLAHPRPICVRESWQYAPEELKKTQKEKCNVSFRLERKERSLPAITTRPQQSHSIHFKHKINFLRSFHTFFRFN